MPSQMVVLGLDGRRKKWFGVLYCSQNTVGSYKNSSDMPGQATTRHWNIFVGSYLQQVVLCYCRCVVRAGSDASSYYVASTFSVWFESTVMLVHTSVLQAMYCSMQRRIRMFKYPKRYDIHIYFSIIINIPIRIRFIKWMYSNPFFILL